MKTLKITFAVFTFFLTTAFAWSQEGVIVYEVKENMHRALSKEREAMKAMIPEFNVSKQVLYFNPEASLYKRLLDEEEEAMAIPNDGTIRVRMAMGELYLQPAEAKRVSLREFSGKKYIVQDSLTTLPWK